MQQLETSILQDICKATGLLSGAASANSNLARSLGWALQNKSGVSLQATALQPVLATLGDKTRTTAFRFEAQDLNLGEVFFPREKAPGNIQAQLNTLKKELEKHNGNLLQMLRVLEWHGSTIACHPDFADISIYDFIKTSAAIAQALSTPGCTGKLRLIGASVSGIQDYLYDIISKNAAKLLKGRSFYVQLLTDSLLDELLYDLKLPHFNVVYSSGGGFNVIAPDTPTIKTDVKKFFDNAGEKIYQKHKTTLFVDWAVSIDIEEDFQLGEVWKDLKASIDKAKFKRLAKNPAIWQDFFEDVEFGGTKEKDPITNIEFGEKEKPKP